MIIFTNPINQNIMYYKTNNHARQKTLDPIRRLGSQIPEIVSFHQQMEFNFQKTSIGLRNVWQDWQAMQIKVFLFKLRYHNHLDATILHTEWTREEEIEMYKLHDEFGNKWAIISQKLSGR